MKNRGLKSSYTVAYFKVHHSTCNEAKTTNVLNRKFLRDNPLEAMRLRFFILIVEKSLITKLLMNY
ncbi:hypothetical protein EfmAA818_33890 (plasmid) [Enterococcus faecium]|nr:hypothetical protein EfmAA818_33890 [Enterococcus faecium]